MLPLIIAKSWCKKKHLLELYGRLHRYEQNLPILTSSDGGPPMLFKDDVYLIEEIETTPAALILSYLLVGWRRGKKNVLIRIMDY